MNKTAKSTAAVGLALSVALGLGANTSAQIPQVTSLDPQTASCGQIFQKITQLINASDAIVQHNKPEQAMHGNDPSALVNRASNLGIAEVESSEANTFARIFASKRCTQQDGQTCEGFSARISQLDDDADRLISRHREDQSLRDPTALLNRVGDMFISQKESADANTIAILSKQINCEQRQQICEHSQANITVLMNNADEIIDKNNKNQSTTTRRIFVFWRIQDPSALVNRAADVMMADTFAKEANTEAIASRGCI